MNTDKCKQNQTWHKHRRVQSQVQLCNIRVGKQRLCLQATVTHQDLSFTCWSTCKNSHGLNSASIWPVAIVDFPSRLRVTHRWTWIIEQVVRKSNPHKTWTKNGRTLAILRGQNVSRLLHLWVCWCSGWCEASPGCWWWTGADFIQGLCLHVSLPRPNSYWAHLHSVERRMTPTWRLYHQGCYRVKADILLV